MIRFIVGMAVGASVIFASDYMAMERMRVEHVKAMTASMAAHRADLISCVESMEKSNAALRRCYR